MKRVAAPERTRERLRALMDGRLGTAPARSNLVLLAAQLIVEEALEAEVRDEVGREKAETYAKALNVRLGRVIAVTEPERGHRPMPMMARSVSQADVAPPIETGTNEIVARVTVMWELKQD